MAEAFIHNGIMLGIEIEPIKSDEIIASVELEMDECGNIISGIINYNNLFIPGPNADRIFRQKAVELHYKSK